MWLKFNGLDVILFSCRKMTRDKERNTMYYYIIGFLIMVFTRFYINICYAEKKIVTSVFHECGTVALGMYYISVCRYLALNIPEGGAGALILVLIYIPMGFLLPLLYVRYRSVFIMVINVIIFAGFTVVFRMIMLKSAKIEQVLFLLLGSVIGYVIFYINSGIFETIKRGFIIKRRKKIKLTKFLRLECVVTLGLAVAMFLVGCLTYRIASEGGVKDESLKELHSNDSYDDYYYAEKDNFDRYDEYAELHPEMTLDEVVWRVEANLDKPFYSDVNEYDISEKNPLLLNKYNRVPDDYVPDNLVSVYGDFLATPETKAAFEKMRDDMNTLGYKLHIVSSYRSVSYQKGLFNTFCSKDGEEEAEKYSARAGFSEHCTGRALDLSNNPSDLDVFADSEEGKWVYENAYKYGFILRYPKDYEDVTGYMYESWHFSYVGTDISYKMHDENIVTLEEYVVKYVEHQE